MVCRWLIASCRCLGVNIQDIDIAEGFDVAICTLRSPSPRICSISDFFQGKIKKNEKNELSTSLTTNKSGGRMFNENIRTAEQIEMLISTGLVRKI